MAIIRIIPYPSIACWTKSIPMVCMCKPYVGTAPISNPYVWAEYAKKHPHVRFVFTHIGYYEFGMSTIEAVKDLPNVWVETSGQMDVEVLKKAIAVLGFETCLLWYGLAL